MTPLDLIDRPNLDHWPDPDTRFSGHGEVRSIPLSQASPPPAEDRPNPHYAAAVRATEANGYVAAVRPKDAPDTGEINRPPRPTWGKAPGRKSKIHAKHCPDGTPHFLCSAGLVRKCYYCRRSVEPHTVAGQHGHRLKAAGKGNKEPKCVECGAAPEFGRDSKRVAK